MLGKLLPRKNAADRTLRRNLFIKTTLRSIGGRLTFVPKVYLQSSGSSKAVCQQVR